MKVVQKCMSLELRVKDLLWLPSDKAFSISDNEFLVSEILTSYKLPCSSKTCLPQAILSRGAFAPSRRHSTTPSGRQFLENKNQLHALRLIDCITYIQHA